MRIRGGACFHLGCLLCISTVVIPCLATEPAVSNVTAAQRAGEKQVDISYDVSDAEGDTLTISVEVSTNRGATYDLSVSSFTGSGYGYGVAPGTDKAIVWDAGTDWSGNYSTQVRVRVTAEDGVYPPNPEDTAGGTENGVVSLLSSNVAFLYSGTNAVQTGVAAGAIEEKRVAVLRGRVVDSSGDVLKGVIITVEGHSEYGQTVTRTNGCYDMVVNGGGALNLNCVKTDYLPVQRTIDVPWQDYVNLDDITMLHSDSNLTTVALGSRSLKNGMQVAEGSTMTDQDGTRRVRVMIPPGTRAWIITDEGTTQEVDSLTTRFTEFTVGTNGPSAMPGDLPPSVAYTYAAGFGALEAQAKVAGKDVLFSTQVYSYVENFLGMPTGTRVPVGYYNDTDGAWVPAPDGRVIQLVGTSAEGLAEIDIDGDGLADDESGLSSLGFTDAERAELVGIYAATQSLWRVPMDHFSTFDYNYGITVAADAVSPQLPAITGNGPAVDNSSSIGGGGIMHPENQSFSESIPVLGTPFTLNYSSERMPGYFNTVTVPITGDSVPDSLKWVRTCITVAGRAVTNVYAPASNLDYDFSWDGRDAYGRFIAGEKTLTAIISYVYQSYYALPPPIAQSFGFPSGARISSDLPSRQDTALTQTLRTKIAYATPIAFQGLGGWTLSAHHSYDPDGKVLLLGTGRRVSASERSLTYSITTYAGDGYTNGGVGRFTGDGGLATNASLNSPYGIDIGPDGSLYIADAANYRVRRVDPDGVMSTFAGNSNMTFAGDGGPATNASFNMPSDVAVGPDGSVYVADLFSYRVRRVDTNGIITTIAGNGTDTFSGDGGLATEAGLVYPAGLDVTPDGTIYIGDSGRVRRVGPDGYISTIAGAGDNMLSGDGGPATNAGLMSVTDVAVASDGSLYVVDGGHNRIRRVGIDGIITTVAGNSSTSPWNDGGVATNAGIQIPYAVACGLDDCFYVADYWHHTLRCVGTDGIITTIAGNGTQTYSGDDGPSTAASMNNPIGVVVGEDGSIYISDQGNNRIRRLSDRMPGVGASDILIASEDGSQVYQFNYAGRHLRTMDTLTGSNVLEFSYDTNGFLTAVTDGDGNVTTIQRDGAGNPTGIVSQYGQTTELALDSDGYLASVENPAGETTLLDYSTNGLLTSIQGAKGGAYTYYVDYASGRAVRMTDPAGGSTSMGKSSFSNRFDVASTSALGRVTTSSVEDLPIGNRVRTRVMPDNSMSITVENLDGAETNVAPDGTVTYVEYGPDPRFGMETPVAALTISTLPSGLASTSTISRTAVMKVGSEWQVNVLTNIVTLNGKTMTSIYTSSNRQTAVTSPEGRITRTCVDLMGRPVEKAVRGLATVTRSYDSHGRLTNVVETAGGETRSTSYGYDGNGYLVRTVDPLGRVVAYQNDLVGRITNTTLPDGSAIAYTYDAHGNMSSVTPPGREKHRFGYTLVDLRNQYLPPGNTGRYYYTFNVDRQVTKLELDAGQTVTNIYDNAGRLSAVGLSAGVYSYSYLTNGLVAAIDAPSGVVVSNSYDGSLPVAIRWTGALTGMVGIAYDNDFRVASLSVNGGNTKTFGYDDDGLQTNVGSCALIRHADNRLLAGTLLNNVSDTYSYNGFGEITNYTARYNGSNIYVSACGFDKLGRITSRTESVLGVTNLFAYSYDTAGRLSQVITNGTGLGTNIYLYDSNGCRTNFVGPGVTVTGSCDGIDRLITYGNSTNFYNKNGDLTNRTVNGQTTEYSYDGLGNLLSVKLPAGDTVSYVVDGKNRRVGRRINGVFTNGLLYSSALLPFAELSAGSNLVSVFVYGSRANVPDYMVKTGTTYRIVSDHLGSVRLVINTQNGDVMQRMSHDEFGKILEDTNPGYQPFGFAGGIYDYQTGLVRFGVRDFDPDTGRWTARDPLLFNGGYANLYAYSFNDPVNLSDIMGMGPTFATMTPPGQTPADQLPSGGQWHDYVGPFGTFADFIISSAGHPEVGNAVGNLTSIALPFYHAATLNLAGYNATLPGAIHAGAYVGINNNYADYPSAYFPPFSTALQMTEHAYELTSHNYQPGPTLRPPDPNYGHYSGPCPSTYTGFGAFK